MRKRGKTDYFHTCEITHKGIPRDSIVELHLLLCRIAKISESKICFGGGGRKTAYVKTGKVVMQITIQKHSVPDYKGLQRKSVTRINYPKTTLGRYTYRMGFGNE